jgi:ubiquinone/menaquinone biosynthesis C-methylase UbiE
MTSSSKENGPQPGEALTTTPYVCPKCKGGLAVGSLALRCDACGRTYPLRNNIPDFIAEDLQHSRGRALRVSGMFDRVAPIYETNLFYPVLMKLGGVKGIASLPALLAMVEEMMGTILGDVLDAACGPGTCGRRIAPHARAVFGVDISAGMVEQGQTYAQREHVTNMNFARALVDALPFAKETFAAALCCGSLHLFEDTTVALREIARTLKPGALLVGTTFIMSNTGLMRFAMMRKRYGSRLLDVKKLGDSLSEAGFEDYRPRTYGSGLVFSVHKSGSSAARPWTH